jgi:hypothetical protein
MKLWIYLTNTFLVVTDDSYRTAKKIGDYTLNALLAHIADPLIAPIHAALKPFVDNYNATYNIWLSKLGTQKSMTNDLTVNLKLLSSIKIKTWDIAVQAHFLEGTTGYIGIFPNHRTPFQNGSQEDRLAACEALSIALTGIVALAPTKTNVDAFIVTLKNSFNIQKGSLSNTAGFSNNADTARVAMCIELYSVLGKLMSIHKANPSDIEQYFDLETIRNHQQTLFKGTLHPSELALVMTHTFMAGEQLRLTNKGATKLRFALCPLANSLIVGSVFKDVAPNDEVFVDISELGNIANRFLKVENMADTGANKYSVMLL